MFPVPPFPPILRPIPLRTKWQRFDANRSQLISDRARAPQLLDHAGASKYS